MVHIRGAVTIRAPVEEVFDTVANECNEPRYNSRVARAQKVSDGPIGKGARFTVEPRSMGRRGTMLVEIVEYDRPHRLHNVIESSYMRTEGTLVFEEAGGGTRLRWEWHLNLIGPTRALTPLLALIGPRWERRNWVALKTYMESMNTMESAGD